jgi:hypothetical protein
MSSGNLQIKMILTVDKLGQGTRPNNSDTMLDFVYTT